MKNDNFSMDLMVKVADYYVINEFDFRCHSPGVITYTMVDDPEDEDERPVHYTIDVHKYDLDIVAEIISDFPADDATKSELDKFCQLIHQRIRNGKFVFYYQTETLPNMITFELCLNCSADNFTDELMDRNLVYSSATVHIFGKFFRDIIEGLISAEDAIVIAFSEINGKEEDEAGCDEDFTGDLTNGDSSDKFRTESHNDGGDYWFYCNEA